MTRGRELNPSRKAQIEKNDDDRPSCSCSRCRLALQTLAEEYGAMSLQECIREIATHGFPAQRNPAQPSGKGKGKIDDSNPIGSSLTGNKINESLADKLCGMALDDFIIRILTRFGGPDPEKPAQPSGGPSSASGDSKKPVIAELLQLQEGRGGPAQSRSEIAGVSGKGVGTPGSVGSRPGLECGPECEASGSGCGPSTMPNN